MFFYLSKIIWALLNPANLIALLLIGGLVALAFHFKRMGRLMLAGAVILVLGFGVFPLGNSGLYWLENRVGMPATMPDRIDGILVLGGAINTQASDYSGRTEFNEGVERVTTAIMLSRLYPDARVVFSGGNAAIIHKQSSEAGKTREFLAEMQIHIPDVIYEEKSRNTYENIQNSRFLIRPAPDENWLIVTSAFHQPRSLAIAKKQGWDLIPYPVDYRSQGRYLFMPRKFDVLDNLYASGLLMREVTGLAAYKLTGKI